MHTLSRNWHKWAREGGDGVWRHQQPQWKGVFRKQVTLVKTSVLAAWEDGQIKPTLAVVCVCIWLNVVGSMARSVSALLSCDVILFRVKFQRIRVYPRYNIFSRKQSGLCNKSAASQPLFVPLWSRSGGETEANTPRGALLTPLKGSSREGGMHGGRSVMLLTQMPLTGPFIVCFAADKTNLPWCSFQSTLARHFCFVCWLRLRHRGSCNADT